MFSSYLKSPIGAIEVKGNEFEIHSVYFVDSEKEPDSNLPLLVQECIHQLQEYFDGNRKDFSINMKQDGTGFQQNVWTHLQAIPYGKTISYLELSKRIGDAKSIRAVGSANGKNKVAIIIPCHRVIGSNDKLVGYAGGLWRKQWLLEHEQKIAHGVQTLF